MADLKDVVLYILKEYPHKSELSNARVTKMVYLSDWKHVLDFGCQVSDIKWYFDNFGPFVWDVKRVVDDNPNTFISTTSVNPHGGKKHLFDLRDNAALNMSLSVNEKHSIDHIIKQTASLYWDDFITLVYSTYPVVSSPRYSYLDLLNAKEAYQPTAVH